MHILIIGGISRSLINFRGPLIRDMLSAGHKVTAQVRAGILFDIILEY